MNEATWTANVKAPPRLLRQPPLFLYGLAVFVSASLVFWVQPLAVRGLLPAVGGAPLVWNTAMLFFQGTLLAGYLLAHLLVRGMSTVGQIAVLALLWSAALLAAWSGGMTPFGDTPPQTGVVLPALWVLGTLAATYGPGCLAVSMLSPLVSAWFARTNDVSADPYVLYAVSNVGSIGILLVYPFVLEPLFGVALQLQLWTAVFAFLSLPLLVLALRQAQGKLLRHPSMNSGQGRLLRQSLDCRSGPSTIAQEGRLLASRRKAGPLVITHSDVMRMFGTGQEASLPRRTALRVLILALLPSALLYGVTLRLSTDVAAAPLLWVLPLALYLGTYALAFGRGRVFYRWRETLSSRLVPVVLVLFAVFHGFTDAGLWWVVFHLAVFGVVAFWCHGLLWELRPGEGGDLTGFYAFISAGGLAGGVVSILLWPLIFPDVWEYPLLFSLAALLLPASGAGGASDRPSWHWARCILSVLAVAGVVGVLHLGGAPLWWRLVSVAVLALCLPGLLALRVRPAWLTVALLYVSFAPAGVWALKSDIVAIERTWFGVYRIAEMQGEERVPGRVRLFFHGTTLHGFDWLKPGGSVESRTGYHAPEGPHGDVMQALRRRPSAKPVLSDPEFIEGRRAQDEGDNLRMGVVGLGAGSLLCYAESGDTVKVYEIDAAVVSLARQHFGALRGCAPGADVKVGDGRLLIRREAPESLDALFLDAFSSGSIPVHLLTLEAFRDYLRVLAEDGVMALHVSSRHLDLEPLLGLAARELGLAGVIRHYEAPPWSPEGSLPMTTHLALLARDASVLEDLGLPEGWEPLELRNPTWWRRAWSDDRSSLVPYLR